MSKSNFAGLRSAMPICYNTPVHMKYAIISDIHANESALRHVLDDAARQGAEQVICLGDVVGYGPLPRETLALVRASCAVVLAGNHDDAVSGRQGADDFIDLAGDAVARHREALDAAELDWLKTLPYVCELDGAVAAHGDCADPKVFDYVDSEQAAEVNFKTCDAPLMFVGHTHVPGLFLTGRSGKVYWLAPQDFRLEAGKRYIVNPGSVGYPREQDGTCLSSYVLYDSSARTISYRFLPFAVSSVMQRGGARKRRSALLPVLATLIPLALASVIFLAVDLNHGQSAADDDVPVRRDSDVSLALTNRTLTLHSDLHYVQANLKVERPGDPVELHVEFLSAAGEILDERTDTVKGSSAKRLKIPNGAISARFTVLKQRPEANPRILSFAPAAN